MKKCRSQCKNNSVSRKAGLTNEYARKTMALLIGRVREDDPRITYSDLAKKLGIAVCELRVHLDRMSENVNRYGVDHGIKIPPLQVLIVNAKTGVPGPGAARFIKGPYLQKDAHYDDLSHEEQVRVMKKIYKSLAAFSHWEDILSTISWS